MAVTPQNTLADNQAFLMNIGYLAVINGRGPFSGNFVQSAIGQYRIRENIKDVIVGDHAYSGNEWGKVISVSGDVTNGFTFEVKFNNTVLPAGIDHATWNPSRVQKYASMLPPAATVEGLVHNNAWQKLASIGVIVVENSNTSVPTLILQSASPVIVQGGTATSLDFNIAGVSVQKLVNDVPSGAPVVANGSGVASIPNGNTTGQSIKFAVSLNGQLIGTFGPYIVG
jgi:hypothetical protein